MLTVFFDLDGTLTDPLLGIARSIRHALIAVGQRAGESEDLSWCIGPPLLDSLTELVGPELAAQALHHYRERFSRIGLYENALYAGVPEMLARLNEAGLKLCVASSKPKVYVERIVDHFELRSYFEGIYGSELDGARADKAKLLGYALTAAGAAPALSTMVGDRRHDVAGAIQNGMKHIGVLYGYGSADELKHAGANRFADTPLDLISLLLT